MYEEYYGFVQPPFSLTPDPRFLYRSESHDLALQQVWQAIRRKEGFIVLTGDIGTGKTTLCRTLLEQFDQTTFTALILNPFLSVEELLREVLLSFGVVSKDALKAGRLSTASKHELIRTLHDFLLSLVPLHGSAVLIIDEAQHLSHQVLEEIRILSNLETNDQKLLQIVIVGQLNLLDLLHKAELRQLDQRISIRCSLKALTREEVEAYVTHRLWVARGSTSVTFTPRAFELLHALSGGVPRMINLICDKALMAACEAETSKISEDHIGRAGAQLGLEVPRSRSRVRVESAAGVAGGSRRRLVTVAGVLVVLAGLAGGAYALVGNPVEFFADAPPPTVRRAPSLALPAPVVAVVAPSELPPLGPPPLQAGPFVVVIGTFDTARAVAQAEALLVAQKVTSYSVDIRFGAADVRRRLLVGRFATEVEADALREKLAPLFADAKVVASELERLRVLP